MKNNLMLFLAVFFLSVSISKADIFEDMFEELTKDKETRGSKRESVTGDLCDGDCLDGDRRTREEIMQVVNANMPDLKKLYNEYLKQKPGFSGKVILKFIINASGKIIDINIVSSTTGYAKFDKAIKDAVSTWKWKAIKNGNTTPTIPFNFTEDDSWDI